MLQSIPVRLRFIVFGSSIVLGFLAFLGAYFIHAYFKFYGLSESTELLQPIDWLTLVFMFIFIALFVYYRFHPAAALTRIRRLAGLDNMEYVVQRAAELGKPILFSLGQLSIAAMSNIAGMEYLRSLARHCARYSVPLYVITRDGTLLAAARDVVKWAYDHERRGDLFDSDRIFLLSPEQFAFAASAGALMMRIRPAGIFIFGYFRAESLYLLETARASGAMVVGATDEPTQMPFLLTCCHYPMIGEELFAAGALAGDSPVLRASVRVQDIWRTIAIGLIIGGMLLCGLSVLLEHFGIMDFDQVLNSMML